MADAAVFFLGMILLAFAVVGYFWQTDTSYTYPQIHEICISDLGQMAQYWGGGDQATREACNRVQMITYAIYGTGLVGIILMIVGAVRSGDAREPEYEESDMGALEEAYAKGEFSKGEYESKKKELEPEEDETPIQILKKRYAKGEISKEEFENMKKDLEN